MNNKTAYLILRLAIGASMFGHGLVRLPKLPGFSAWMVHSFEKSILPPALVTPFSYLLPIAELIIGICLLLGLFTRVAAIAGGLVMVILVFGSTTTESWENIPTQLIHAAFFAALLAFIQYNGYALDQRLKQ